MPTSTQELPPMPKPEIPLAKLAPDGKTVLVDTDWYRYLKRLEKLVHDLRLEIP